MNKTCLIRQPAGIGDIIYCQKIGHYYQSLGYNIIWPVAKVFDYIPNYLQNFNYVCEDLDFPHKDMFLDMSIKEIYKDENLLFIPLNGHNLRDPSVMKSKYILNCLDFSDWKDYIYINRNSEKEDALFNLLNLDTKTEYRLTNYNFASPPHSLRMKPINFGYMQEIEFKFIDGFTLFDWMKVIENATEICMTDSAPALLVEILKSQKTKKLVCLLRQPSTKDVKSMYVLNWKCTQGIIE